MNQKFLVRKLKRVTLARLASTVLASLVALFSLRPTAAAAAYAPLEELDALNKATETQT